MAGMAELLKKYDILPKHSWGQNFLSDGNALDRIMDAIDLKEDDEFVLEYGAGLGALTEKMAKEGRTVVAVERDRELCEVLRQLKWPGAVEIMEDNAKTFDLEPLFQRAGKPFKLVGNLPYQLTSPLLFKTLRERHMISQASFLIQAEVAKRLAAQPGGKDYSILSIIFQRVAKIRKAVQVKRGCFIPIPKVDSTFIILEFVDDPELQVKDEQLFIDLVKASFNQRRKTIANSIKTQPFVKLDKAQMEALKSELPWMEKRRAEELSIKEFVGMCETLHGVLSR